MCSAVLAVVSVLFWSLKAGLLALIPNMFPVLVNFGAMGALGFALGPGTFPVAMIAFGIAVDDTIHFLTRYLEEREQTHDETIALRRAFTATGTALISPLLALHLGCVLAFFVTTPYSKMAHGAYRFAALVREAQLRRE